MTTDTFDTENEIIQKMGRLIEITRVLDRNRDDTSLLSDSFDTEIVYVFDTNIVQMFLEPFRNPHYAEIFHARIWGGSFAENDLVNRQSCLLAAEYLMSGGLPGQLHNRWYMSVRHHEELRQQMEFLAQRAEESQRRLGRDKEFARRARRSRMAIEAVRRLDPTADREMLLRIAGSHGAGEIPGQDSAALLATVRTRELCRLLSDDRIFEPATQLSRFHSRHIAGHAYPLEQRFKRSAKEDAAIREEAGKWQLYLREAIGGSPFSERSKAAIENDCQTLALIHWAMRNRVENETIVFVTGDRALYNAYRRRRVEEPDGLPFLLRPVTQYASLFNPTDAGSILAEQDAAFSLVRETVEAAAVPLNLGLFSQDRAPGPEKIGARDHFILKAEREPAELIALIGGPLQAFRNEDWLRKHDAKLDGLVKKLREFEARMLGAYPELVAKRLGPAHEEFVVAARRGAPEMAAALAGQIRATREQGIHFALAFMPDVVRRLLEKIERKENARERGAARISVHVQLRFEVSDEVYLGHAALIEALRAKSREELPSAIEALGAVPARVFALAALLAFSLEFWDEAARFAELAASASEHDPPSASEAGELFEYLYLRSVALRFRLSARRPTGDHAFFDPWAQWRARARHALDRCVDWHREQKQLCRLTRALSERAAVQLAYCAWFAFGELGKLRTNLAPEEALLEALGGAVADLAECDQVAAKAEAALAAREASPEKQAAGEILGWALRQYPVNILAARAIAERLIAAGTIPSRSCDLLMRLENRRGFANYEALPDIARAYVLSARGALEEVRKLGGGLSLELDAAIIEGLGAEPS